MYDQDSVVVGDFNAYTQMEPDFIQHDETFSLLDDLGYVEDAEPPPRHNQDLHEPNQYGRNLLDMCKICGLRIVNGRFGTDASVGNFTCITHRSASTIDYILAESSLFRFITDFSVLDRLESIHMPIVLEYVFQFENANNARVLPTSQPEQPEFYWNPDNQELYLQNLCTNLENISETFHNAISRNDCETSLKILTEAVRNAATCMKARRRINKNNTCIKRPAKTWFDNDCERLRTVATRAIRHFRYVKIAEALSTYKLAKSEYKELIKNKKNAYFERQRILLANAAADKNPKTFWNMLKSRTKSLTSDITPDQWYEHFHGVFNPPNVHEEEINYNDPSDIADNYLDHRITESEVLRAIRTLKTGKSPGIDGLSIQFIKTSSQHLVPYLVELFNMFYDSGYFPPEWTTSILAPIHKKGSKDDPNNYRGVSLLPEISKIFTSIINNRLKVWCDTNEKIGEEQSGFVRITRRLIACSYYIL